MKKTDKSESENKWLNPNIIPKIRKFSLIPLLATNIYNAAVSTFYFHIATTTFISILPAALTLSIVIGLANITMALIVSYNTLVAKDSKDSQQNEKKNQDRNIKIFLAFAIPAFLFNFIANLIAPYISLPLIGAALALPTTSPLFIGICIFIGAFTAIAFLFYNIVQIYEVCLRIKPSLDKEKKLESEIATTPSVIKNSVLPSSQIKSSTIYRSSASSNSPHNDSFIELQNLTMVSSPIKE